MKKIAIISSIYSPYTRGGAETVVKNIVRGFANTHHKLIIITLCPFNGLKSLFPRKIEQNEAVIYRFYALNLFSYLNIHKYKKQPILRLFWHFFDMFNLHSYWVIKHILKKEKPDVVLTHVIKGIGYTACRAVKSSNIKNIHTVHDVQLVAPSGLIIKGQEKSWQHTFFLTRLYKKLNIWLLNSPDIVISSSKFLLDFYSSHGFFKKSKRIVLTNPINIKTQEHENIKIKKEKKLNFLFLGQVEEHKGIFLLINVFKNLLTTNNNIKLNIVGTGSALTKAKTLALAKELKGLSAEAPEQSGGAKEDKLINFLGHIPNSELNKIFVQTDALIIPSLCYENSPTVIFESLSHGVPVIAARIGGIEFIRDNYNGFTFEAGDENDLQKVLEHVIQNKKQLPQMQDNCLESVKNIGIQNYIKKLEELI